MDGKVVEPDGKTENAQRTSPALTRHIEALELEAKELWIDYDDHGLLICWDTGKPPHTEAPRPPDRTDLHDVRHSYATAGRDAKIDWKALSGHADVAFTMRQYVQANLETDRQVAITLADLIIGGALVSVEVEQSA